MGLYVINHTSPISHAMSKTFSTQRIKLEKLQPCPLPSATIQVLPCFIPLPLILFSLLLGTRRTIRFSCQYSTTFRAWLQRCLIFYHGRNPFSCCFIARLISTFESPLRLRFNNREIFCLSFLVRFLGRFIPFFRVMVFVRGMLAL